MSSQNADRAFAWIVDVEGTLSMDPKDPGNWTGGRPGVGVLTGTKYGVSAKAHPGLNIAALTLEQAHTLFLEEEWTPIRGDELPWVLALCVADDAYNHGTPTAIRTLQATLGVTVDGDFGPKTLTAASNADPIATALRFQTFRALEYASDPNVHHEGFGWFHDRVLGTFAAATGILNIALGEAERGL